MKEITDDIYMMGIGPDTYEKLLNVAKKENKSVNDVTSEALKKFIDDKNKLQESQQPRKLLMEG